MTGRYLLVMNKLTHATIERAIASEGGRSICVQLQSRFQALRLDFHSFLSGRHDLTGTLNSA